MRAALILACVACCLASCSGDGDTPTVAADLTASSATTASTSTTSASTTTTVPKGPYEVATEDRTLTGDDPPLFVRTWTPVDDGAGTRRLIVLAHGLAGEPDKFDELSSAWAEAGYVVAAPRFPNSSVTGGAQVEGFTEQPALVTSVIDQLTDDPELRLDPDEVGVAGLSLGGSTIYALTTDPCCTDPRIRGAAIFDGLRPGPFGDDPLVPNQVPVLVLHCQQDFVLPYAEHAVEGFARLADPAWLVSMPCNEHAQPYEDDPSAFDGLVEDLTLDLWASVLGHDAAAAGRIANDVETDGRATVEVRAS
jgi:predicted dienelactone hydrolase